MKEARKYLSAKGLFTITKDFFSTVSNPSTNTTNAAGQIRTVDCLMSGLSLFSLKYSSLLKFEDEHRTRGTVRRNLQNLFSVFRVPSDTTMRERLDEIDPKDIRGIFKKVFAQVQRGKALESYKYLDGHYLMPLDGTGFYSSDSVHCASCCVKNNKKCNLKIVDKLPDAKTIKKNTYYLLKEDKETPWQLLYCDNDKTDYAIKISNVNGLCDILVTSQ